jgi:hypothetical protein
MAGITEEAGKVGTAAIGAMSAQPLAIALLIVNVAFLAFAGYVLGQVAANAQERNKTQMELIKSLAEDLTSCRSAPLPPRASGASSVFKIPLPPLKAPPIPISD